MSSRSIQIIAAALTIGIVVLLVIALGSIKQRDPRRNKLTHIDIEHLSRGHFIAVNAETLRYYVIHPTDGDLYVVAVPLDESAVPMPENHWWKPMMKCRDFGLDSDNSTVAADSQFRCRDTDQPKEWSLRWQWDIRGRHLPDPTGVSIDDMYRVRFERSGDEIILTALETS